MWRDHSNGAVFVPQVRGGTRVAHSEKLLKTATRVRVHAAVSAQVVTVGRESDALSVTCALTLNGPHARLLFRKGAEREPDDASVPIAADSALLPSAPRIVMSEQLLKIAPGSAPMVWVTFQSARRTPFANTICLGRCEDSAVRADPRFEVPATINVWLKARRLSEREGPVLSLIGELTLADGVSLQVRLATDCNRIGEPDNKVMAAEFPILPPGAAVEVPQRAVAPGTAGNPWVSFLLRDWAGGIAGEEVSVGRCVQLH